MATATNGDLAFAALLAGDWDRVTHYYGLALGDLLRAAFPGLAEAQVRIARERAAAEHLRREADDRERRRRLAEFDASDPVGRVAEMRRAHAAASAPIRARYGIAEATP